MPGANGQRHHNPLPNAVDGRIRHLGKQLLEVSVEQLGTLGQNRQRSVIPH